MVLKSYHRRQSFARPFSYMEKVFFSALEYSKQQCLCGLRRLFKNNFKNRLYCQLSSKGIEPESFSETIPKPFRNHSETVRLGAPAALRHPPAAPPPRLACYFIRQVISLDNVGANVPKCAFWPLGRSGSAPRPSRPPLRAALLALALAYRPSQNERFGQGLPN